MIDDPAYCISHTYPKIATKFKALHLTEVFLFMDVKLCKE